MVRVICLPFSNAFGSRSGEPRHQIDGRLLWTGTCSPACLMNPLSAFSIVGKGQKRTREGWEKNSRGSLNCMNW